MHSIVCGRRCQSHSSKLVRPQRHALHVWQMVDQRLPHTTNIHQRNQSSMVGRTAFTTQPSRLHFVQSIARLFYYYYYYYYFIVAKIFLASISNVIHSCDVPKERTLLELRRDCSDISHNSTLETNWCHLMPSNLHNHHWLTASILCAATSAVYQNTMLNNGSKR